MVEVSVFLSKDFRATALGYPTNVLETPYELAARFDVDARDNHHACEIAFAVCNSYPEELHCDKEFLNVVKMYRAHEHRSLSVGDFVLVSEINPIEISPTFASLYVESITIGYSCGMTGWNVEPHDNWPPATTGRETTI